MRIVIALLLLFVSGCAMRLYKVTGTPALTLAAGPTGATARVEVIGFGQWVWSGNLVVIRVTNEGSTTLRVNRHKVLLRRTDDVYVEPEEGLGRQSYVLQPGEDQQINCRYSFDKIKRGDELQLDVNEALWSNGKPLKSEPIALIAD